MRIRTEPKDRTLTLELTRRQVELLREAIETRSGYEIDDDNTTELGIVDSKLLSLIKPRVPCPVCGIDLQVGAYYRAHLREHQ